MWRDLKEVSVLPEQEAMTSLLFYLRKVPGFRERAQELAESYGDSLNNNINNNNNKIIIIIIVIIMMMIIKIVIIIIVS